ncbi:MAG: P1 family peptidase, partial [Bauldia sp.]|nr:P1 family peptidase [Bauldia sp.]
GGSAFGLDAAGGVASALAAAGRGFEVAGMRVPLVPAAILFDLANGGDKAWGDDPPYARLGRAAVAAAARDFALGTAGAGAGATTASLKGGLGSASTRLSNGATVAALVAVNAVGAVTVGGTGHFWAAPFETGGEFGGLGLPSPVPPEATALRHKLQPAAGANTTIAVIATDAALTKAQAKRLAMVTHDGFARAIWPSHTPFDGDLVFALSTGRIPPGDAAFDLIEIGAAASACMARAIARGVYEATPAPGDLLPTWRQRFGD